MIGTLIQKTMRGIGVLLALTAVAVGVTTLRFAVYAPQLLNDILRMIGD